jgi:hypothetical protein
MVAGVALDADALNVLGIEKQFTQPIERKWIREIGNAFIDLMDGKIDLRASSTDVMPGSKPYKRDDGSD